MQEIRRVGILGAGAIGAYFASRFYETEGFTTALVARGNHYEKLSRNGLTVNGKHYQIPVVNPEAAAEPLDLLIVALKHQHMEAAIPGLDRLIGTETTILSMMNGIQSEAYIGGLYGMDKVLYALSLGIDALRVGNEINYTVPGTHYFGEAENKVISPRVRRVQEAFDKAGIAFKTPEDMLWWLWWKLMVNVGANQVSAVTGSPYQVLQTSQNAQALMEALMREVVTVAQAEKIKLTEKDITAWYPVLNRLSPRGKTSMLQDIEARQKTEVELFAGEIMALGKKHNIPTPVNQTVFQIIRVLEQGFGLA